MSKAHRNNFSPPARTCWNRPSKLPCWKATCTGWGVAKAPDIGSETIQYWQSEAQKVANTAYGEHLLQFVRAWTDASSQPTA